MEIQKKQKWRLRSLPCYLFAALSYQPGQHCVLEFVLSLCLRDVSFCLLPCYHIALESWNIVALHPFLWNVIYWSLKWALFSTCTNWATPWDQFSHLFLFSFWGFILTCLKHNLYYVGADQMIHMYRQLLTSYKAHVDLSDSLKGPKISFKQGLMDSC